MIESLICYIIQGQSSGESLGDPSSEVGMSSSSDAWSLSAQFDMLHLLDEIPWTCGCWVLAPFITGHSWCHQLEPRTGVPLCDHWGHWGVNDILTGSSPFKGWISANSHHSSISIQFIDIHSIYPISSNHGWWLFSQGLYPKSVDRLLPTVTVTALLISGCATREKHHTICHIPPGSGIRPRLGDSPFSRQGWHRFVRIR